MATLNPGLILGQQYAKMPDFNMGDTMVQIAKLKAYQQNQKLDELKLTQAERAEAQKQEWQQLWGEVWKPQAPAQSGLTGAPAGAPQTPQGAPQPPAGPQMSLADVNPPGAQTGAQMAQQPIGAGPPQGLSQTEFTGPMGMAANIPTNEWMDVNTQTGEWGQPPGQGGLTGASPYPNMPPEIQRVAQPPIQGQPTLANPAMQAAPQPPTAAPTPPQHPQGLATERPGLPEMPGLQMPQMNEQAFWRAYQKDPERTTKEYGNLLELHGKKLEQTEKTNDTIYNTLLAVEESKDPATMWPRAIKSLRQRGIPIPKDMPEQYDPALAGFLLKQHEGVKTRLENAKISYYSAQAVQNRALARKQESEVKTPEERRLEVRQKLATLEETWAKTTDLGEKRKLDRERVNLEAERNIIEAQKVDTQKAGQAQTADQQKRTSEQSALGEWNKINQPYRDMGDAVGMIEAGGKGEGGPAADQLVVNGFLRLSDIRTGIRDGERTDFMGRGGLLQQLQRGEAYITGTTQLRPEFKREILQRTRDAYGQAMQDYDQRMVDFRSIAERQKLDPNNVVVDFRSTTKKAQEQPPSASTRTTADPTSSSINKEDFMEWRRRQGKKGNVSEEEVNAYFKQRGGRE